MIMHFLFIHLYLLLQDCLRSCQEQVEETVSSNLMSASEMTPITPTKSDDLKEQPTTPTDVRDIHIWTEQLSHTVNCHEQYGLEEQRPARLLWCPEHWYLCQKFLSLSPMTGGEWNWTCYTCMWITVDWRGTHLCGIHTHK